MKYFIQRKKILNVILGVLTSIFIFSSVLTAVPAYAQESCETVQERGGIILQVQIPGVTQTCIKDKVAQYKDGRIIYDQKEFYYVESLQQYIVLLYKFFIGLVAFAAVFMLMIGGAQYILAGGNPNKVSTAKSIISGALGGLFLALTSYVLLATINPRIVSLQIEEGPKIDAIQRGLFCKNIKEVGFVYPYDIDERRKFFQVAKTMAKCGKYYLLDVERPDNFCLGTECLDEKGNTIATQTCIKGRCTNVSVYGDHRNNIEKHISGPLKLMAVCEGSYVYEYDLEGGSMEETASGIWVVEVAEINLSKLDFVYGFPVFSKKDLIDKCTDTKEYKWGTNFTIKRITKATTKYLFFLGLVQDNYDRDDWYTFGKPCGDQYPFVIELNGKYYDDPTIGPFQAGFDDFYNKNKNLFISIGDSTSNADIKFDNSGNIISPFKCDITLNDKFDR